MARACQRDGRGDCTPKPVAHNAWRFSNGVSRFTDLVKMPVRYFQGRLRASLYGTLLQTLPDLVTPLKGHSLVSAQLSSDAVSALRKVRVLI